MTNCWPFRLPRRAGLYREDNSCLGAPSRVFDPPFILIPAWIRAIPTRPTGTGQLYFALERIILAATRLNSILRASRTWKRVGS